MRVLSQATAAQQVEAQVRSVEDAIRGKLNRTRGLVAALQVCAESVVSVCMHVHAPIAIEGWGEVCVEG